MNPTPTRAGFYWAKWRIAADGTVEGDEQTPSDTWEVVDVAENCIDPTDDEYLMVYVPGVSKAQSIENFFWGPGPLNPPDGKLEVPMAEVFRSFGATRGY